MQKVRDKIDGDEADDDSLQKKPVDKKQSLISVEASEQQTEEAQKPKNEGDNDEEFESKIFFRMDEISKVRAA